MTKEDHLQVQVMSYMRYQYPEILAFHTPNGGNRNAQEGAKFKRMGVLPGVPDILIPVPQNGFNGLCIELKIKPNRPTPQQLTVMAEFKKNNWHVEVCYDFDAAIQTINNYLNPKKLRV